MSSSTFAPHTSTVDLGNGFSTTTTYENNAQGLPISIESDTYQNGVLTSSDTQNYTYNNNVETVSWKLTNKTLNTTSSGSYTMNMPYSFSQ